MSTNQKRRPTSVTMDVRKLLRAFNSSAQSKVQFFEESVRKLGMSVNRQYRLSALNASNIIFEDVDSNVYYLADTKKDGTKYRINNVRRIEIGDREKPQIFEKNCLKLVDKLSEQKYKQADKVWKQIESQRFRSQIIPESGLVTTKDGITRRFHTHKLESRDERISTIVEAIVDTFRDNVDVVDGEVVCGVFSEDTTDFTLPVDEMTCRRVIARQMKEAAREAYKSKAFQRVVKNVAGLVSNGNLKEAVSTAAKFMKREQEFSLLSEREFKDLIDDTLAASGIFNPFLCKDASKLLYLTNLRANHTDIVESWTKTAHMANNADLMEHVDALRRSKNFIKDYNSLLDLVFNEDYNPSSLELRDKAYAAALHALAGKVSRDNPELAKEMLQQAEVLADPNKSDTAARNEAEAILGAAWSKLGGVLSKYDEFGGEIEDEEEAEEDYEGEEEMGEPIEFSPDLAGADELGGPEELGPEAGLDMGMDAGLDMGMGGADMGMGGAPMGAPGGGMGMAPPLAASKQKGGVTFIENMGLRQLKEELDFWKTDGHIYLREDGFDDCFEQMQAYISRSDQYGPKGKKIAEGFRSIRDYMVETGTDVMKDVAFDRYKTSASRVKDVDINHDYLAEDSSLRMGEPWSDVDSGGQKSGEFRGDGLADKSAKDCDGASGEKEAGSGEAASGDGKSRMSKGLGPHKGQGGGGGDKGGNLSEPGDKLDMTKGAGPHKGQGGDEVTKTKGKGPKGMGEMSEGEVPDSFKKNWKDQDDDVATDDDGEDDASECMTDDQYHQGGQKKKRTWGRADAAIDAQEEGYDRDDQITLEDVEAVIRKGDMEVELRSPMGDDGEIASIVAQIFDGAGDMGHPDEFAADDEIDPDMLGLPGDDDEDVELDDEVEDFGDEEEDDNFDLGDDDDDEGGEEFDMGKPEPESGDILTSDDEDEDEDDGGEEPDFGGGDDGDEDEGDDDSGPPDDLDEDVSLSDRLDGALLNDELIGGDLKVSGGMKDPGDDMGDLQGSDDITKKKSGTKGKGHKMDRVADGGDISKKKGGAKGKGHKMDRVGGEGGDITTKAGKGPKVKQESRRRRKRRGRRRR